jgi:hypothetical protein
VSADEDVAITRIDQTIDLIKRAAIDDGKDLHDHPEADDRGDHRGRLHRAEALLHKVEDDIAREEDDPMTRGLRDHAIEKLSDAIEATHRAIHDAEQSL